MYKMNFVVCFVLIILTISACCDSDIESEWECAKYAKYTPTIDSSIFIVRKTFSIGISTECSGTLVSNQYFLTSNECGENLNVNYSYVIPYRERFEVITDVYTFGWVDSDGGSIALLKLKHPIDPSQHRPACLWTKDYRPNLQLVVQHSSNPSYIPEDPNARYNAFKFEPVGLLAADDCQKNYNIYKNCFYTTHRNPEHEPNKGSPILYYDNTSKSLYVTGIFLNKHNFKNGSVFTAVELSSRHIEWIKSIVWSKYITSNVTCGQLQVPYHLFVPNGSQTFPGQFPWHVAIYHSQRYICDGTIITSNIVVTAAHCLSSKFGFIPPDVLTVEVAKYERFRITYPRLNEFLVDSVLPHEHYRQDTLENDIAILKLVTGIKYGDYIQPACITNDTNMFTDTSGIVPGWNLDENNSMQRHQLKQATLEIRTNDECRDSNRGFFVHFLNGYNFCANYKNGTNVCTGYSGSGLVVQNNKQSYLRGIVSLGVSTPNLNRCDSTELILFTDVVKYYDWIMSNL